MKLVQNTVSKYWINKIGTEHTINLFSLSIYKTIIQNFINILTGNTIPVRIKSSGKSYTNGDSVTISADISEKNLDVIVGLALHEGSHIMLSDFMLFSTSDYSYWLQSHLSSNLYTKLLSQTMKTYSRSHACKYMYSTIKLLTNYIEDRRIDNYIYTTSPGYQGYYKALYDKYWNSELVSMNLLYNPKLKEPTWDSYKYRIFNFTNPHSDVTALPGLNLIYDILDLKHISRLSNTSDSLDVAIKIYEIISDNIISSKSIESNSDSSSDDGDQSSSDTTKSNDSNSSIDEKNDTESESNSSSLSSNEENSIILDDIISRELEELSKSGNNYVTKDIELTDKQISTLSDHLKDLEIFIDTNLDNTKISLSNSLIEKVNSISKLNLSVHDSSATTLTKLSVIIINKISYPAIESGLIPGFSMYSGRADKMDFYIKKGIILGNQMYNRLKYRNDDIMTTYTRKRNGRIDKSLLFEIGNNNINIFKQHIIQKYPAINLHISVDISGSMTINNKWEQTLTLLTAISTAIVKLDRIRLVISFRTTSFDTNVYPVLIVGYDSLVDDISKIYNLFKYIDPIGYTPEGICFEAMKPMLSDMIRNNYGISYFLNISDGIPYIGGLNQRGYQTCVFSGEKAIEFTRKTVNDIRKLGYSILSYFIPSYDNKSTDKKNFETMYGRDATFIDVTNLSQIIQTLNSKFMEKNT